MGMIGQFLRTVRPVEHLGAAAPHLAEEEEVAAELVADVVVYDIEQQLYQKVVARLPERGQTSRPVTDATLRPDAPVTGWISPPPQSDSPRTRRRRAFLEARAS